MPTARELLEQADALMRRNRTDQVDDIPVLTDAVPSPDEAPLRAVAPAPAATGVPPSGAAPPVPNHEGEPSDWLEIEDAHPSVIGNAPDSVAIVPPVVRAAVDDARRAADEALLQSAEHEEIELTPAVDEAPAAVEPPPEPPMTPPLPPPHESRIEEVGEWSGTGDPLRGAVDAPRADAATAEVTVVEIAQYVEMAPLVDERDAGPPSGLGALDVIEEVPAATTPPAPEYAVPPAAPEAVPSSPAAAVVPSAAALAASFAATMPSGARPAQLASEPPLPPDDDFDEFDDRLAPAQVPVPGAPVASTPVAQRGTDDPAHWDSVAEEIRMQVLQRIDLFTDTGLREQLGERLKPIVDRASADLVATINQHVGELLRAYVAETIEREIERWRREN